MSKSDNMLAILWLLRARKRMTAKALSEELEMNIRTVYRYIDALCASGVPIIADSGHNGGYQLLDDFIEAPLFFNADEQKALVHAARFAIEAGYPYGDVLDQAITKLKRYSNEDQREAIDRYALGLDVIQPPFNQTLQPLLQDIEKAVVGCCTLSIDYQKEHAPKSQLRSIDPYGLVYWLGKWYVVGHCHLRQAIRSFRVDRIHQLTIHEKHFERPPGFDAKAFFLERLLPITNPKEELIDIHIAGHPQTLKDLRTHWFLGHTVVDAQGDEIHFRMDKKSALGYLPHILLSYEKSIHVIAPQILREKLVAVASDLLTYYQSNELH
ncbi:putative DNA-binding transcriptional regulator YafY [Pullulanibacillus pueri]|uniref:DNA-binding transcriptional regulator n=1 Tax=Pullulanibacillus pueri TaxID=1437324 RepID=A0A8J2ZU17_9BACL|nr:YafY family protein [Pullulanibacillus pueri]MBM7681305.1 putative DNA-binding transcriptional regulator YafY [Pullulanibacillus pueri]GGH77663.1 DNA-binding transcriptional regulator [Pullulanibacillus pueri]